MTRDFAWTESSGSDSSAEPFTDDSDRSSQISDDLDALFARHGPLLEADPDSVHMQRLFWRQCAMGFILDYRKFSVAYLQCLIRSAWRLQGEITVVGRDSFFYVIILHSWMIWSTCVRRVPGPLMVHCWCLRNGGLILL